MGCFGFGFGGAVVFGWDEIGCDGVGCDGVGCAVLAGADGGSGRVAADVAGRVARTRGEIFGLEGRAAGTSAVGDAIGAVVGAVVGALVSGCTGRTGEAATPGPVAACCRGGADAGVARMTAGRGVANAATGARR